MNPPGLYFQTVPPARPEALPRMDVAAFVGFAESGPLHVPVPIDDLARFEDVFGGAFDLAVDPETGRMDTTYLAGAVRAFFRNGGTRCWVVRVAQDGAPSRFVVPGLVRLSASSEAPAGTAAVADARSPGTRFDALRVGTRLRRAVLPPATFAPGPSPTLTWTSGAPAPSTLQRGDLLRIDLGRYRVFAVADAYDDTARQLSMTDAHAFDTRRGLPTEPNTTAWTVEVTRRTGPVGASMSTTRTGTLEAEADGQFLLVTDGTLDVSGTPVEEGDAVTVAFVDHPGAKAAVAAVDVLDASEARVRVRLDEIKRPATVAVAEPPSNGAAVDGAATTSATLVTSLAGDERTVALSFASSGAAPKANRVVHVTLTDVTPPSGESHPVAWAQTGNASVRSEGGTSVRVELTDVLWPVAMGTVISEAETEQAADAVTQESFDLLAFQNQEVRNRLLRLGFSDPHPRSITGLRSDETVFAWDEVAQAPVRPVPAPGSLDGDAYDPRFPLAHPGSGTFIPLGMPDRTDSEAARERLPDARSRLERAGVEHLDLSLFVDDRLANIGTERLATEADDLIYIRQVNQDEAEADVRGLHALWSVPKPSLLAVPDATHRPWMDGGTVRPDPPMAPVLSEPEGTKGDPVAVDLTWEPHPASGDDYASVTDDGAPAFTFELEEATRPDFTDAAQLYRGRLPEATRYVRGTSTQRLYFRVRAIPATSGVPSGWSVTKRVDLPPPDLEDCVAPLSAPDLFGPIRPDDADAAPPDAFRYVAWVPVDPDTGRGSGITYDLQVALDPTFQTAETVDPASIYETPAGTQRRRDLPGAGPAVQYVRVRARRNGETGPWSRTAVVTRRLERPKELVPIADYDATLDLSRDDLDDEVRPGRASLVQLQRVLLRFCAARGDVLSVLSLPLHDRSPEIRRHLTRLRSAATDLDGAAETNGLVQRAFRPDERRTLSFGAVYAPWITTPRASGRLATTPPDGAACGMIAARTMRRGAWIAPANQPFVAVESVRPVFSDAALADLLPLGANVLRRRPAGFTTRSALTLSEDDPLRPIATRRLLILLRRLVERDGADLVFESNTRALRRRLKTRYEDLLRRLFRRGAFAGETPPDAFRVVTGDSVNPPGSVEQGRLVVELQVAPARALQFLTVRLIQRSAGRRTLEEAA